MPNYKETTISGTSWRRTKSVLIDNTYQKTPFLVFEEEDIFQVNNNYISKPTMPSDGRLAIDFNPEATIPLLDPSTGQPTGATMTHADLYVALNSLYMQLADLRDNPPVVTPPPPPPPATTI